MKVFVFLYGLMSMLNFSYELHFVISFAEAFMTLAQTLIPELASTSNVTPMATAEVQIQPPLSCRSSVSILPPDHTKTSSKTDPTASANVTCAEHQTAPLQVLSDAEDPVSSPHNVVKDPLDNVLGQLS